jgi:SPOR domain
MPLFSGMDRSKLRNAIYSILLLAFFFAVGLAGGVLYREMPTNKTPSQPETKVAEESTSAASTTTETSAATTTPAATPAPAAPVPPAVSPEIAAATPETTPQAAPVAAAESQPAPKPAEKSAVEKTEAPAASPGALTPPAPEAKTPARAPAPKPPAAHQEAAKPARNAKTASIAPAGKPAPPKQAAVAPKAAAKHVGADVPPFRIQFGAFAIEDNAHRTQWAVEATGMAVEVTRAPSRKGRMLYYVRSQPFPTRAAALAAAIAARDKAKKFEHPEKIEYVVLNDAMIASEEGHKASVEQP